VGGGASGPRPQETSETRRSSCAVGVGDSTTAISVVGCGGSGGRTFRESVGRYNVALRRMARLYVDDVVADDVVQDTWVT
jgi:nitrogen regulatory protein PII